MEGLSLGRFANVSASSYKLVSLMWGMQFIGNANNLDIYYIVQSHFFSRSRASWIEIDFSAGEVILVRMDMALWQKLTHFAIRS